MTPTLLIPTLLSSVKLLRHLVLASLVATLTVNLIPIALGDQGFDRLSVQNVRRVFDNGEHNAFTDLIRFRDRYYLTFRSCPDGHMVHPTASIIVLSSNDLISWSHAHQFSVPLRDTRDPHFLEFNGRLFVYTGTWYCGETSPKSSEYDLNEHLGYGVFSEDGREWSEPNQLEGTFGHYIWRAAQHDGKAYLCGRRKHQFDIRPRGEGPDVESAMLVSDDGLIWKTHSLFQERQGDETAFLFEPNGAVVGVSRRGRGAAELVTAKSITASKPYAQFHRTDLGNYIGGPLLARWGDRYLVGGRRNTAAGPVCAFYWLNNRKLTLVAELPSGGDCSYPGFLEISPEHAVVSWYSSHEKDADGNSITAIYLADLFLTQTAPQQRKSRKERIEFESTHDQTRQQAYLSAPIRPGSSQLQSKIPMVVSLHSWSGDMEQRHDELEALVAKRGWFCLQPNFRGVNDHPTACGSPAAIQDIADAVRHVLAHYPVDSDRVYLTGTSGGGHMAMMMCAKHPDLWAAASAWVGISDLTAWYEKHANGRYGQMMRLVFGGAPEDSDQIAREYKLRSPKGVLSTAKVVPLDIATGIHDGHSGSVPVRQSLEAYNEIAASNGDPRITANEIEQLSVDNGRLKKPGTSDLGYDSSFEREFYLRRQSKLTRITVFEGGHEGIPTAAMSWFDRFPVRQGVTNDSK